MTLRAKTSFLIGSALMGLVIVIYGGAALLLRRDFAELEAQLLTADVRRVQRALAESATAIDRTARDYAFWDDSYAFVLEPNDDFIAANLIDDVFIQFSLNFILIFDADGRLLYGRAFDLEEAVEAAPPAALLDALQPYLQPKEEGYSGLLTTPDNILLLAVRPILPSVDPAPPAGVFIMGRYLDESEAGRLSDLLELALTLQPVGQAVIPPNLLALDSRGEAAVHVEPQNNQTVIAYSLVDDLNSDPALLLTVTESRFVYQQGLNSLRFILGGVLASGLVFTLLGLALIERLVLARVDRLAKQVAAIGEADETLSVQISGQDELSQLADGINDMLARLSQTRRAQRQTEQDLQQNLRKTMLLNRIIAAATAVREPHEVMSLVCAELAQELDLPQVAFALLESGGQSSRVVAEYCAPGRPSAMNVVIPLQDNPLTQAVLETRRPVYIANAQTDPEYGVMQSVARQRGTVSVLVTPLIIKGEVVGTLGLNATEERAFTSMERDMIVSAVRATSRSLENARLYTALQRELAQRKQTEEALQKAKESAEAANIAKSEFVSVVSHELKVPLTAIQGFADLMAKGVMGPVTEPQARHLQMIISNAKRLNNLIGDLTDISKIETGRVNLQFGPIDVGELIEEAVQLTEDQVERRGHRLDVAVNGRIPTVWADRDRLLQILTNLISNAYKYTPDGGRIIVAARATVSRLGPQGGLKAAQITVKDNGIGIRVEEQQQLFQRFFRSGEEQARQSPGAGLGLSIVKNLLEMQGGRIWFESVYGRGSSFHFIVPLMDQLTPLPESPVEPAPATDAAPPAAESPLK